MNWEIKKLGEVCEELFAGGDVPKHAISELKTTEFNIPIFSNGEKNKGLYGYTNKARVSNPSITISARGTIGYSEVRYEPFYPAIRLIVATPNKDKLSLSFLKYALIRIDFSHSGTSIPQLTVPMIREYEFPIPPLPEQHQIVSLLDKAFAAIAQAKENVERNLQNAKELFQSELNSVFIKKGEGWVEKKLGDCGTITSSKRIYKNEYVSEGIPFYRTKEIKELSNGKDISLELFISKERYYDIKKHFGIPQIGDVLMSAVGTIGEILVIENNDEFYFKDGNIVWLKGFKNIDSHYLKYALTAFVEEIKKLSIGSAYNALTIEKLNEHKISIPSLETQTQIVHQLDSLSAETKKLEGIYKKKLDGLEELKKSVLEKAFRGELVGEEALVQ